MGDAPRDTLCLAQLLSALCASATRTPDGRLPCCRALAAALLTLTTSAQPIDRPMLDAVHRELGPSLGCAFETKLRDHPMILVDEATGRSLPVQPIDPQASDMERALESLLARANAIVAAPPDEDSELVRAIVELVSDFLGQQPYAEGNAAMAQALLAALVRRAHPDRLIVHLGPLQGCEHRSWCTASMTHQMDASNRICVEVMVNMVNMALERARRLVGDA